MRADLGGYPAARGRFRVSSFEIDKSFSISVQTKFENGDNLLITILSAVGEEMAVGVKMST